MQLVVRECKVEAALRWVKGYDSALLSFVNTIPTPQGGTHVAGFDRALGYVINDVCVGHTQACVTGQERRGPRQERRVKEVSRCPQGKSRAAISRPDKERPPAAQSIVYEVVKQA